MKIFTILVFSILFLTGCNSAKFDTSGEASAAGLESDANGLEIVSDGEASSSDNDSNDGDRDSNDGEDDTSDTDSDSNDGDDEDEDDIVTPDEIFGDDDLQEAFACDEDENSKKVVICQLPNNDLSKRHTLCVSKASLKSCVKDRRQDRYFLGACEAEVAND